MIHIQFIYPDLICLFGQVQPHPIFPIQVQAVKLNIGVTVTANLAIFLFLVQVVDLFQS